MPGIGATVAPSATRSAGSANRGTSTSATDAERRVDLDPPAVGRDREPVPQPVDVQHHRVGRGLATSATSGTRADQPVPADSVVDVTLRADS